MTDSSFTQFRSPLLMNDDDSAVLIIDVQEKLLPVVSEPEALVERTKLLISGAQILKVPVLYTEQYPQGLGNTVESLRSDGSVYEKRMFSCRECGELLGYFNKNGIRNVVIAGIEAHICVLQSALDCMANGFNVHVVVDAISSRRSQDQEIAIKRMEMAGVTLTTAESTLFQWCETAQHDQFKAISNLVK